MAAQKVQIHAFSKYFGGGAHGRGSGASWRKIGEKRTRGKKTIIKRKCAKKTMQKALNEKKEFILEVKKIHFAV
jgi:hypothetical protein